MTRAQGDLSKTTFAPERVLFTRGILPKYPESDWFCNRIKVEKEHVFLAWEQDTDSPIQEVKVENATLYTPVQTAQNSFKDVKSGNTGDAGITLYLGMGLVAVMAGAVIVTRKRKEN